MDDKNICTFLASYIHTISAVLSKGDRVELIPIKDGVKIIHIQRKEIRDNS